MCLLKNTGFFDGEDSRKTSRRDDPITESGNSLRLGRRDDPFTERGDRSGRRDDPFTERGDVRFM